jgi:hypothetical protein
MKIVQRMGLVKVQEDRPVEEIKIVSARILTDEDSV